MWGFLLAHLSDRLLLYPYVTLPAVCVQSPRRSVIYYILLAALGAVSGVYAYYPHPGGHALPNFDHPLYTFGWLKLIIYGLQSVLLRVRTLYKTLPKWLQHVNHM